MTEKTKGRLKLIAGSIAGMSAAAIMENIITATTPEDTAWSKRVGIGLGSMIICWIVGTITADYVDQCIETTERMIAQLVGDDAFDEAMNAEGTVE